MSEQLSLALERPFLMGERARALLDADVVKRMKRQFNSRNTLYLKARPGEFPLAWFGRGQLPAWVKQHLSEGGTLKELEATL